MWIQQLLFLSTYIVFASCAQLCCPGYGCTEEYDDSGLGYASCPDVIQPVFHLFTRQNRLSPQVVTKDHVPDYYNAGRARTFFLVHGFRNDETSGWMHETKDALLERADLNVIIVGWGNAAKTLNYWQAAADTYGVGLAIKAVSDNLMAAGTPNNKLWCVGHSLGAHTCGHAGILVHFGRITGLDPAGPSWASYDRGLKKECASFVEVIHTDGYGIIAYYGTLKPMGHVDFYPDRGYNQPGCITGGPNETKPMSHDKRREMHGVMKIPDNKHGMMPNHANGLWPESTAARMQLENPPYGEWSMSCSHSRAPEYFMHSVRHDCFRATHKCHDPDYVDDSCPEFTHEHDYFMGYSAAPVARGLFYVPVSDTTPFCQ